MLERFEPAGSDPGRAAPPARGMCVLTIHRVVEECERDHDITWASFRGLLDAIAASGAPTETDLLRSPLTETATVALTFDDGTSDHAGVAQELARREMRGIFFIPAGKVGTQGRLGAQELQEIHALGNTVGSHGCDDVLLDETLSPWEITHEMRDSKQQLEDALGAPVQYFAPPGGRMGGLSAGAFLRHGYEASRSMAWGIYRSVEERWTIPSIPVTEFTLARGWVAHAVRAHTLPLAMRCTWILKDLLPEAVRLPVRKMLHQPFKLTR
jgi:hypothetical protein